MRFNQSGLTLVELLLALALFAVLSSTLYLTVNTLVSPVASLKRAMDDRGNGQRAMERILADLNSVCITPRVMYRAPELNQDRWDRFRFQADTLYMGGSPGSRLSFSSFEHLAFDPRDNAPMGRIQYGLEEAADGSLSLHRRDTGLSLAQPTGGLENAPVLCPRVLAFEIRFVDHRGEEHTDWDSDSAAFEFATPRALRILLMVGDEETPIPFRTTLVLPVAREVLQ